MKMIVGCMQYDPNANHARMVSDDEWDDSSGGGSPRSDAIHLHMQGSLLLYIPVTSAG